MVGTRRNPMRVHERETEIDFVSDQFDKFGVFALDHLSQIIVFISVCILNQPVILFVRLQCILRVLRFGSGVFHFRLFAPVCERR